MTDPTSMISLLLRTKRLFPLLFLLACLVTGLSAADSPPVSYRKLIRKGPMVVHLVEIDPKEIEPIIVAGMETGFSLETVASMAMRYGAIAAINGGFFADAGQMAGVARCGLKIDGEWYQLPTPGRVALGWKKGGVAALIGRPSLHLELHLGEQLLPIQVLNQPPKAHELALLTPAFHRSSLTSPQEEELLILGERIVEKRHGGGKALIPIGGQVVAFGRERKSEIESLSLETSAKVVARFEGEQAELWEACDYLVGGSPWLVREGKVVQEMESEKVLSSFLYQRHPRTALGLTATGHWLLVVVDGRKMGHSMGATAQELAKLLVELGAVEALNLDGGSSSTLFFANRVVNQPASSFFQTQPQGYPVGHAILLCPRPSINRPSGAK